jgi:hypothetical protein
MHLYGPKGSLICRTAAAARQIHSSVAGCGFCSPRTKNVQFQLRHRHIEELIDYIAIRHEEEMDQKLSWS